MLVSITSLTHSVKVHLVPRHWGTADVDLRANLRPRDLCLLDMESSLVFFHSYRIRGLTLEAEIGKSGQLVIFVKKSLIIVHKAAFVSVKSCNSVEDVWVHPCSETS